MIKRLESSFHAFRNTVRRFIATYERFLEEFEKGNVYVSKKHTNKIFEFLESNDEESIEHLIEEEKSGKVSIKRLSQRTES